MTNATFASERWAYHAKLQPASPPRSALAMTGFPKPKGGRVEGLGFFPTRFASVCVFFFSTRLADLSDTLQGRVWGLGGGSVPAQAGPQWNHPFRPVSGMRDTHAAPSTKTK